MPLEQQQVGSLLRKAFAQSRNTVVVTKGLSEFGTKEKEEKKEQNADTLPPV